MQTLNKLLKKLQICSLIIFFTLPPLFAQSMGASADSTANVADSVHVDEVSGLLYLDFKGATLINVLQALSKISKINFVAGDEISTRKVNLTVDGVNLEQSLEAIARGSNLTYDFMPNTNIIVFRASSDQPNVAPLFTRVFKLYFLRASKIQEINAGRSSSGGSGSSGGGLQSLSSGDKDTSKTVEVAILAIIEKMLSERGSVAVDDRSNSLIATDSEDRLDRIAAVIAELDRPLNQVLISVLLVETFEDLDRELGVEWARGADAADGLFGVVSGGSRSSKFPFNIENNIPGLGNVKGLSGSDAGDVADGITIPGTQDFRSLNVRVKALQSASKLHIIAKPNVLVMDNHPAIIKIATNAAIGTTSVTTGDGAGVGAGTTADTAERAEIGTILRVTPQINSQDQITMTIEPTFATVDASTIAIGGGTTGDPTVRAARTTVMVNSGKTLVMGGLMFSTQSEGDRKVPFLADVPILGKLFTKDDKAVQDRELVLFLTPQIIKNPAAMNPVHIPDRAERFDDVNAEFWKYKKKTWYKNMATGGPKKPIDYDSFFKVRENTMDQAAYALQDQKEMAMKKDAGTVGAVSSATEGVKWDIRS